MLASIAPKLPMRNKAITRDYYVGLLGFEDNAEEDYDGYLMVEKEHIEIHFFEFADLNPAENYGQVYIRVNDIEEWYAWLKSRQVTIHPNAPLQVKPWGQKEFSLLDPDNNLLTFGEAV
jgi:catechol 2,3-dioxygenase-like lactoylglutathione lyase family enzyme